MRSVIYVRKIRDNGNPGLRAIQNDCDFEILVILYVKV